MLVPGVLGMEMATTRQALRNVLQHASGCEPWPYTCRSLCVRLLVVLRNLVL